MEERAPVGLQTPSQAPGDPLVFLGKLGGVAYIAALLQSHVWRQPQARGGLLQARTRHHCMHEACVVVWRRQE